MGCISSRTTKTKGRDTLSQEGARETAKERQAAAEDELLSRQNASARQAAGIQRRDEGNQVSPLVVQDRGALEDQLPNQATQNKAVVVDAKTPVESAANITAKPDTALDEKGKKASDQARGYRMLGNSIEILKTDSNVMAQSSLSNTENCKRKQHTNKNSGGHRRHRNCVSERSSESASTSHSPARSDAKRSEKDKDRDNKKKQRRHSTSSSSQTVGDVDKNPRGHGTSIAFAKEYSPSAHSQPQAGLTSTSRNSMSVEFLSNATPLAILSGQHPNPSISDGVVDGGSVVVSSTPRSVGGMNSRGRATRSSNLHIKDSNDAVDVTTPVHEDANTTDLPHPAPPLLAATVDDACGPTLPSPASVSSANISRIPYEPYNNFTPRDGIEDLPPYEWVPRTMPVPLPLRQGEPHRSTTVTTIAPVDGHFRAHGSSNNLAGYADHAVAASFLPPPPLFMSYQNEAKAPPRWKDDETSRAHFYDPVVGVAENAAAGAAAPPLVRRTFYHNLPPVEWLSYGAAPLQPPSSAQRYSTDTVNTIYPASVEEDELEDNDAETYGDIHALYSPVDAEMDARSHRHIGAFRRPIPPSLIDVYVSDNDEDAGVLSSQRCSAGTNDHFTNNANATNSAPLLSSSAYPQPKISIVPSPYAYGPSPMVSAASVASVDDNGAENTFSGQGNNHLPVAHDGVNAHRYKPVTYLFDNSMDNWLQSRRLVAPQRQLYADAADLW